MTRPRRPHGTPTRFASVRTEVARALLLGLALLVAFGLALPPRPLSGQPGSGDAALYRAVAARVAQGEDYYRAAASEQRQRGYPLRPVSAIRPPLLAELGARLGPRAADLLLRLLGLATAAAIALRLLEELPSPMREAALALAALSGGMAGFADMWVWHEMWAGLLVALALACRSPRHWLPSVLLALLAALIREFALPILPLMAIAAGIEGRRREAGGWVAATALALLAYAAHAWLAAAAVRPDDAASPGWLALGGWSFDLALARHAVPLLLLPAWAAPIALPLSLLGWWGWRSGYAARVTAVLVAWLGAFLIVGRADNDYWGFLLSPMLAVGLAMAPAALRDLALAARPAPRPAAALR